MLDFQPLDSGKSFLGSANPSIKKDLSTAVRQAAVGIRAILAKIDSGQLGAFRDLSEKQARALQGLCQSLRSCAVERHEGILSQDLQGIAAGILSDPTFAQIGEAILQAVVEAKLSNWTKAEHRLAVHLGTAGTLSEHIIKGLRSLSHTEAIAPMALGMAGAGFVGKFTRLAATHRLRGIALVSGGTKLGVHALSGMVGLFSEAGAFPAVQAGANFLMGQSYSLASYDQQAWGALKTIGLLRVAGGAAQWVRRGSLGVQFGAELSALTLLNAHENTGHVWAAHFAGALRTTLEFRAAGDLTQVFAPRIHLANEHLNRAAYEAVREAGLKTAQRLWRSLSSPGNGRGFSPHGREALAVPGQGTVALPGRFSKSSTGLDPKELGVAKMGWDSRTRRGGPGKKGATGSPTSIVETTSLSLREVQRRLEGQAERLRAIYEREVYFEGLASFVQNMLASREGSPHPDSPEFIQLMRDLVFPSHERIASLQEGSILWLMVLARPGVTIESHQAQGGAELFYEVRTYAPNIRGSSMRFHPGAVMIEGFPVEPGKNTFFVYPQTNRIQFVLGRRFTINGQEFQEGDQITYDRTRRVVVLACDMKGQEISLNPDVRERVPYNSGGYDPLVGPRIVSPEEIIAQFASLLDREDLVPITKIRDEKEVLIANRGELEGREAAVYFTYNANQLEIDGNSEFYVRNNRVVIGRIEAIGTDGRLRLRLGDGERIEAKWKSQGPWGPLNTPVQGPVYVSRVKGGVGGGRSGRASSRGSGSSSSGGGVGAAMLREAGNRVANWMGLGGLRVPKFSDLFSPPLVLAGANGMLLGPIMMQDSSGGSGRREAKAANDDGYGLLRRYGRLKRFEALKAERDSLIEWVDDIEKAGDAEEYWAEILSAKNRIKFLDEQIDKIRRTRL